MASAGHLMSTSVRHRHRCGKLGFDQNFTTKPDKWYPLIHILGFGIIVANLYVALMHDEQDDETGKCRWLYIDGGQVLRESWELVSDSLPGDVYSVTDISCNSLVSGPLLDPISSRLSYARSCRNYIQMLQLTPCMRPGA